MAADDDRVAVSLRITRSGVQALDRLADETGATRSDAIRALLGEAMGSRYVLDRARRRMSTQAKGGSDGRAADRRRGEDRPDG